MDAQQPEPDDLTTYFSQFQSGILSKLEKVQESKLKAETENATLRSDISKLHAELEQIKHGNEVAVKTSEDKISGLRLELRKLKQASEKDAQHEAQHMEKLLSQARSDGEASGRERALDDIEKERRLLLRSHLEHLEQAREEARAKAYQQGLQEAGTHEHANTSAAILGNLNQQLDDIRKQHAKELSQAKKLSRQEGREMAYRELSLETGEALDILLDANSDLSDNIKIRELRIIFQNWNDIPQRALPSYLLPEDHALGDKTLYLLARLSKEVDSQKAGVLLKREVYLRQKYLRGSVVDLVVTNSDIENVLGQICTEPNGINQSHRSPSTGSVTTVNVQTPNPSSDSVNQQNRSLVSALEMNTAKSKSKDQSIGLFVPSDESNSTEDRAQKRKGINEIDGAIKRFKASTRLEVLIEAKTPSNKKESGAKPALAATEGKSQAIMELEKKSIVIHGKSFRSTKDLVRYLDGLDTADEQYAAQASALEQLTSKLRFLSCWVKPVWDHTLQTRAYASCTSKESPFERFEKVRGIVLTPTETRNREDKSIQKLKKLWADDIQALEWVESLQSENHSTTFFSTIKKLARAVVSKDSVVLRINHAIVTRFERHSIGIYPTPAILTIDVEKALRMQNDPPPVPHAIYTKKSLKLDRFGVLVYDG